MKQYVNEYDEALDAITSGMLDTSDIEPYLGAIVGALKSKFLLNQNHYHRLLT